MYDTGILVALAVWLWNSLWLLVALNSRLQQNLRKAGMSLSWTTLQPRQMTAADRARKPLGAVLRYCAIATAGLLLTVLSWVYVALSVGLILYRMKKNAGKPAPLREFDWKMRNLDLGFDQIAKEMYALHGSMGLDHPEFEQFKSDLWQHAAQR